MGFTVFFGLLCLGPMIVMGDNRRWLPISIPWPAQQCKNANSLFVGECIIVKNNNHNEPSYKNTGFCRSLKCALPRPEDGGYTMVRLGRPAEGTICGILKACHHGKCVDIDPHEIPFQYGIQTTYDCRPPINEPQPISFHPTSRVPHAKRPFDGDQTTSNKKPRPNYNDVKY